jgi:mitochondrial protein MBA1
MSLNAYRAYNLGLRCSASTSTASKAFRTVVSRNYATESALASKTKGAASAKSKRQATAVTSAGEKHTPAKLASRTTGHRGNEAAAEVKTLPLQHRPTATTSTVAAAAVESTKSKVEAAEKTLEEQNLQELEAIQYFAQVMRSADPYGQPIPQSLGGCLLYGQVQLLTIVDEERCNTSPAGRLLQWHQGVVEPVPG